MDVVDGPQEGEGEGSEGPPLRHRPRTGEPVLIPPDPADVDLDGLNDLMVAGLRLGTTPGRSRHRMDGVAAEKIDLDPV